MFKEEDDASLKQKVWQATLAKFASDFSPNWQASL